MEHPIFRVLPLGCSGGPSESDISGYLLYPSGAPDQGIIFDAGTLLSGILIAQAKGNLDEFQLKKSALTPAGELFLHNIQGYLISHAHLDHIAALVINSQVDGPNKFIAATDTTIDDLRDHIFNNIIWPNYGSEGREPLLNKYRYLRLPLDTNTPLAHTPYTVESFRLSHPHDYPSTAFLLSYQEKYVLYFGDTSPDALEKEKRLLHIWKRIAPLVREKKLCGMLLECSVPNDDSAQVVYGHLNPKLMMQEFYQLAHEVGGALEGLKVVVAHMKDSLYRDKGKGEVIDELNATNTLGIDFIFPIQGEPFSL